MARAIRVCRHCGIDIIMSGFDVQGPGKWKPVDGIAKACTSPTGRGHQPDNKIRRSGEYTGN